MALDYAVNLAPGSTYIRLVSIPCGIPWSLPDQYALEPGKGVVLREGVDVAIVAYGPVMLGQAWKVAHRLDAHPLQCRVINLPWLNRLDVNWFKEAVAGVRVLVLLEDHYRHAGQGDFLIAECTRRNVALPRLVHCGVDRVPVCGTADEVVAAHQLDEESIAAEIIKADAI